MSKFNVGDIVKIKKNIPEDKYHGIDKADIDMYAGTKHKVVRITEQGNCFCEGAGMWIWFTDMLTLVKPADFDWTEFGAGKICVVPQSEKAYKRFMKRCEKRAYTWVSGSRPTKSVAYSPSMYIAHPYGDGLCWAYVSDLYTLPSRKVVEWV